MKQLDYIFNFSNIKVFIKGVVFYFFFHYFFQHCFICLPSDSTVVEDAGNEPVPEFIDPEFAKTSPKRSFSVIENERFGLVFAKTGSIISGTGHWTVATSALAVKRSNHSAIDILYKYLYTHHLHHANVDCSPLLKLNIELNLHSLFGLLCTAVLIG
jgi:hypothetical protein